jgi:hypothetical protein
VDREKKYEGTGEVGHLQAMKKALRRIALPISYFRFLALRTEKINFYCLSQ